jgi:hypothetical protein
MSDCPRTIDNTIPITTMSSAPAIFIFDVHESKKGTNLFVEEEAMQVGQLLQLKDGQEIGEAKRSVRG